MPGVSGGSVDVREVIRRRAVEIHFQPIASIRRKALIGVEALTRYTAPDGTRIAPDALFARTAAEGSSGLSSGRGSCTRQRGSGGAVYPACRVERHRSGPSWMFPHRALPGADTGRRRGGLSVTPG